MQLNFIKLGKMLLLIRETLQNIYSKHTVRDTSMLGDQLYYEQ